MSCDLQATPARPAPVPLEPRLSDPVPRPPADARAERLDDGIWQLRIPLPYRNTRSVNCLLLEADEGWILVDCGSGIGAGYDRLAHGLRRAGVEPSSIATLVLTHLHADHSSLAGELVERLGCRVWWHEGPETGVDRLREPRIPREVRRASARAEGLEPPDLDLIIDSSPARDGRQRRPRPDRLLREGDVLRARSGSWEVIAAPGHSAQQMVLYERRRRWLFAADVAYPLIRPYLEWGFSPDPFAEYARTLDRVEALDPLLLLPGHGRPDRRPAARVRAAREALDRTADAILSAVGPEPATGYEITCRVAGDEPDADVRGSWLACALSVLGHHTNGGRVSVEVDEDGRRRFSRPAARAAVTR